MTYEEAKTLRIGQYVRVTGLPEETLAMIAKTGEFNPVGHDGEVVCLSMFDELSPPICIVEVQVYGDPERIAWAILNTGLSFVPLPMIAYSEDVRDVSDSDPAS